MTEHDKPYKPPATPYRNTTPVGLILSEEQKSQIAQERAQIRKDARDNNGWSRDRVKALRAALGLTLDELAQRCGVARRTVQGWTTPERSSGYRQPRGATVVLLEQLESEARRRRPFPGE